MFIRGKRVSLSYVEIVKIHNIIKTSTSPSSRHDFYLIGTALNSYTSSRDTASFSEILTRYQTSLTLIPLGVVSLASLPLLDPTPKLATPLTSLLPTASTAPMGYVNASQHVCEGRGPAFLRDLKGSNSSYRSATSLPANNEVQFARKPPRDARTFMRLGPVAATVSTLKSRTAVPFHTPTVPF